MRPGVKEVLASAKLGMGAKLASMPKGSPESLAFFGLHTILTIAERDWDDAANRRFHEIRELTALLQRGLELVEEPTKKTLEQAIDEASKNPDDIRVSSLEKKLDRLRLVLIELQSCLEDSQQSASIKLLNDTWIFLSEANERRAFFLKPW